MLFAKKKQYFLSLIFLLCFLLAPWRGFSQDATLPNTGKPTIGSTDEVVQKKKLIKILSIDGGGIRGIIPALILQDIESKLKRKQHLAHCFDVMAGTSTGSIIILLLTKPNSDGEPQFRSADIISFYRNLGSHIFYQSWWQCLTTFNGWIGEKYSSKTLENNLQTFFGNCRLRNAITNVVVPAYEISEDDTVFFKRDKAQFDLVRDFYFKDIARAATAAPTYFKPAQIQDISAQKTYTLIDGGVAINNPTMSACVEALRLFGKDNDFLVVSIGTGTNSSVAPGHISFKGKKITSGGKIEWASNIVSLMMNAANEIVDYQMTEVFDDEKKYHRFQVLLDPQYTALDDVRPENIQALERYAQDLIQKNQAELTQIASLLDAD